ncbi:MAG: SsrA-binding protein SmpB [Deltaproteobacteria bacterium]|nr:SsrA-binding protein SmpB [Deltaproteobacteria bacterium]
MSAKEKEAFKTICRNKKASFDYELGERLEAGLVLSGTEVKSLRLGKANLVDSYVKIKGSEAFLVGAHISPYNQAFYGNHDPMRQRKLLLHGREIKRLTGKSVEKGKSVIPLRMYFKNGLAKVEIALAKGKKTRDKRESMKEADSKREMARAMREHNR